MRERPIRAIVWAAAAVFLVFLAVRDLGPGRTIVRDAWLDRATPAISTFGPPSRVVLARDGVRVVGEPVYVNVRLPRWFRRATVELAYDAATDAPLRLGVVTHPTLWQFEFPSPEEAHPLGDFKFEISDSEKVEAKTLRVPFELQRAWQVERNVYRFIITAPGVSAEQPITIRAFRVTAERDPACIGPFCI